MVSVFASICWRSNARLDWQPVQGELKYPMLHIATDDEDKLQPDGSLGLHATC